MNIRYRYSILQNICNYSTITNFVPFIIGVGIVLITVSGIAWRLTSTDAPSCRAMLGLGGGIDGDDCNGRFLTRPNAMAAAAAAVNYGRPQHPYAGKAL